MSKLCSECKTAYDCLRDPCCEFARVWDGCQFECVAPKNSLVRFF